MELYQTWRPGTYPWGLVYDNSYSLPPTPQDASPIQAATTSITIQSVFTVVASSTTSSSTNNSGNIYFENGTCKCPNASVGLVIGRIIGYLNHLVAM